MSNPIFDFPGCMLWMYSFYLTWNTVYATHVNGRRQLNSLILNISMPHVSISPNNVPSAFSCGVSTPNVGIRSPVNELVCDNNGRVTPDICDIGGPPKRGDRLRFFCAVICCAISFSSIRSDGKSNSCCLSGKWEKSQWKLVNLIILSREVRKGKDFREHLKCQLFAVAKCG